jgi:hypothetical protein
MAHPDTRPSTAGIVALLLVACGPGGEPALTTPMIVWVTPEPAAAQPAWAHAAATLPAVAGFHTVTPSGPTIGLLLSGFRTSGRDWAGTYYCWSCRRLVHDAKFWFGSDGSWKLYDDGELVAGGTVRLVSSPDGANDIHFQLCPTCERISLASPFDEFDHQNGPPDWPTITYVAQ